MAAAAANPQLDLLRPVGRRRKASQPFALQTGQQREHALQLDCTRMLERLLLPDVAWTAIDHAGSLNMTLGRHGRPIGLIEAQKRKARGVKGGIPDYLFWRNARSFAIELKTTDGVLSEDQCKLLKQLIAAGVEVSVCWALDQVFNKVREWGLIRPGVIMT